MRAHVLILALLGLVPGFAAQADPATPSLAIVEASVAPRMIDPPLQQE